MQYVCSFVDQLFGILNMSSWQNIQLFDEHVNVYIKINSHDGGSSSATGITLPFDNNFGTGVVTGMITGNDHWDTNLSESNMSGWMGNGTAIMRFYKNSGLNLQAITVDMIGGRECAKCHY